MQNCCLFCLCLSFRIKVKKRYLFWKKVRYFQLSSEWYFDFNIVRSLSISHFTKRCLTAQKRYLFFGFKRSHERHKKVPFLQLEAMFSKARKRYLFGSWKWCSQKREKGAFNSVFKVGKSFRILLIDRCHINRLVSFLWFFLSEFTNPLVKGYIFPIYSPSLKPVAELNTVTCTVLGHSFKIYPPCLILAWVWAILISVWVKLEALSLVQWLSMNDRC